MRQLLMPKLDFFKTLENVCKFDIFADRFWLYRVLWVVRHLWHLGYGIATFLLWPPRGDPVRPGKKGPKWGQKWSILVIFRVFLTKCLSSLSARLKTRQKRDRGRDFWVYMLWKNDDIFDDFFDIGKITILYIKRHVFTFS